MYSDHTREGRRGFRGLSRVFVNGPRLPSEREGGRECERERCSAREALTRGVPRYPRPPLVKREHEAYGLQHVACSMELGTHVGGGDADTCWGCLLLLVLSGSVSVSFLCRYQRGRSCGRKTRVAWRGRRWDDWRMSDEKCHGCAGIYWDAGLSDRGGCTVYSRCQVPVTSRAERRLGAPSGLPRAQVRCLLPSVNWGGTWGAKVSLALKGRVHIH